MKFTTWIALFSQTGSEIADLSEALNRSPDFVITNANTDTQYASQIVPCMWFVPDNISIDSVTSIEGADAATGDTTKMKLMSYDFTSGSTSCLTSGTVVANTTSDLPNAGSEQAYLQAWRISSTLVDAGKVLLCMFRSDSTVNSDYAISVTVKYHLR